MLSERQNYRKAHGVSILIAQIMSKQGQFEFDYNMQVLNTMKECLHQRRKAVVLEVVESTGRLSGMSSDIFYIIVCS